jgi:hypothetical protein
MIKKVIVTNYLGESLEMELARPEVSGLAITDIEGLGPVKATINTSEIATGDGALYNSAKLETRNIVMTLDFRFGTDIETIRHTTYKYFPIKRYLTLTFVTDQRSLDAFGYVESNEPGIFQAHEVTQISVICPDPYFYATNGKTLTLFSGVNPKFEFPFENNSLTEKLINFGDIVHMYENVVTYKGDASVGITITIHALDTVKDIVIYNARTREVMRINTDFIQTLTGQAYGAGDDIIINTKRGEKSVTLLRAGLTTNILNCLGKGSSWFQLSKGDNIFIYNATEGAMSIQFKIENDTIYEGV